MKKVYTYIIEQDEDGIYTANVPELPGCHTQANSLDKLEERIKEAIELYLEDEDAELGNSKFIGIQQTEVLI